MSAVNERLRHTYGGTLGSDTVTRTVERVHHRFDGRPIRDFIPVLVERYAREELRTPA
ncbi:hypothetical protein AB0L53_40310 [Nonomuraea sp. NPDC052129]|uniref:three-helix bundle dimerization domain-containing protein n=1 Tax=Nonomuraea sp. NPDC052129 TaxID=3154651 RepID=UPI0034264FF9